MDRSELVLSICLEHNDVFQKLTKQTLFMLLMTNKLFHTCKTIDAQRTKLYAIYLYNSLYSNLSNLVYMRREKNTEGIQMCEDKRDSIMQLVYNSNIELQDSFFRWFIAQYKSNIAYFIATYMSLYDNRLFQMLKEYDSIVYNNTELFNMVLHYEHNSRHSIFQDSDTFKFVTFELDYDKDAQYLFKRWDTMNGRKLLQNS